MNSIIFIPASSSGIQGSDPINILNTFESFSKNLRTYDKTLIYTGKILTSIIYTTPFGGTINKILNYTGKLLTSIVLSGDIPPTIDTTKTLSYTGKNLTSITYT